MATKAQPPLLREPSLPGVKMAAEGGAREGRAQISTRPVSFPSRGTLTRGLPIGRFSWRARIGPHGTGRILPTNSGARAGGGAGPRRRRQVAGGTAGAVKPVGGRRPECSAFPAGPRPVPARPRPRSAARHAPAGPGRAGATDAAAATRRGRQEVDALQALPGAGGQVQPGGPAPAGHGAGGRWAAGPGSPTQGNRHGLASHPDGPGSPHSGRGQQRRAPCPPSPRREW